MEQKRLILAIGLSFLVFIIWGTIFAPKPPKKQDDQDVNNVIEEKKETAEKKETSKEPISTPKEQTVKKEKAVKKLDIPRKIIKIDTPIYTAKMTSRGAKLISFALKNYRETADKKSPNKEMVPVESGSGTILTEFNSKYTLNLNDENFSIDITENEIQLHDHEKIISFNWSDGNGVVVQKQYIFKPETYLVGLKITVENETSQKIQNQMYLTLVKGPPKDNSTYGFEGPSALINGKLEQIDIDDIEDKDTYKGKLKWIGVQDRYFLSGIIPKNTIDTSLKLQLDKEKVLSAQYMQPVDVESGSAKTFEYQIYIGPKSMRILREYNNDLDKAIYFGWFDVLAKPCLWLMNFLYDHFIPNYGLAIIILTLITKAILWPLGTKSYKSMGEMKKLQPLIKEIKEKNKDNKKKMNEETMALYRTYKINPLGGCLPMFVQLPVFFALYRMLYEAIELRHAPFFGWINDLSAPDRLFHFNFSIPLMEPPYGIPVLTIVMGASMLLQQKMSPPMGDPAQAKMMMLMPIIFTVIFINFSSGLVLYWLINNLVSMGQQYYITKKTA